MPGQQSASYWHGADEGAQQDFPFGQELSGEATQAYGLRQWRASVQQPWRSTLPDVLPLEEEEEQPQGGQTQPPSTQVGPEPDLAHVAQPAHAGVPWQPEPPDVDEVPPLELLEPPGGGQETPGWTHRRSMLQTNGPGQGSPGPQVRTQSAGSRRQPAPRSANATRAG